MTASPIFHLFPVAPHGARAWSYQRAARSVPTRGQTHARSATADRASSAESERASVSPRASRLSQARKVTPLAPGGFQLKSRRPRRPSRLLSSGLNTGPLIAPDPPPRDRVNPSPPKSFSIFFEPPVATIAPLCDTATHVASSVLSEESGTHSGSSGPASHFVNRFLGHENTRVDLGSARRR